MSRITRRTFLRTCTTLATSMTFVACTWNEPSLSQRLGQTQLTLWSTPGSIDQALARWRRMYPDISVRRQVFEASTLADALTQLPSRTTNIPDIIVADSYTIAQQSNPGMWRHVDVSVHGAGLLPAALRHTAIDEQRLLGVPLTSNPLQIWYHADVINDIVGLDTHEQVQAAMGNSWESFANFIQLIHRRDPMIAPLSSCFDDICVPFAIQAMQQQRSFMETFNIGMRLTQQQIIGRAVHFGGTWFDLLKRNSVAMVVGGRWLGPAIARTWRSDLRSPWQTISHPFGALHGPNLVAAIPIQAAHYEQAAKLIFEFAHDAELQTLISDESHSVPALVAAYDRPELQAVDPILPQRTVRDTWVSTDSVVIPMLIGQKVTQLQQSKAAFYAWQQGQIGDDELQTTLERLTASHGS